MILLLGAGIAALAVGRWDHARGKLAQVSIVAAQLRTSDGLRDGQPRILVIGDSRVAAWPVEGARPAGAPALASSGVNGETSARLLARWQHMPRQPAGTVVLILTGVNDLVAAELNPDHADRIEADLVRNVVTLARQARHDGLLPVIGAIGQPGEIDWLRRALGWSDGLRSRIARSNRRLDDAAQASGLAWFDTNRALGVGPDQRLPAVLSSDTLHWNTAAYRRLEKALAAQFAERRPG